MIEIPKDKPVVIKFSAEWCGPCKQLAPIVNELKGENEDVEFLDVDIEEEREFMQSYGIKSIPALIFIKNGEEVNRTLGMQSSQDIQENINLLLE